MSEGLGTGCTWTGEGGAGARALPQRDASQSARSIAWRVCGRLSKRWRAHLGAATAPVATAAAITTTAPTVAAITTAAPTIAEAAAEATAPTLTATSIRHGSLRVDRSEPRDRPSVGKGVLQTGISGGTPPFRAPKEQHTPTNKPSHRTTLKSTSTAGGARVGLTERRARPLAERRGFATVRSRASLCAVSYHLPGTRVSCCAMSIACIFSETQDSGRAQQSVG